MSGVYFEVGEKLSTSPEHCFLEALVQHDLRALRLSVRPGKTIADVLSVTTQSRFYWRKPALRVYIQSSMKHAHTSADLWRSCFGYPVSSGFVYELEEPEVELPNRLVRLYVDVNFEPLEDLENVDLHYDEGMVVNIQNVKYFRAMGAQRADVLECVEVLVRKHLERTFVALEHGTIRPYFSARFYVLVPSRMASRER